MLEMLLRWYRRRFTDPQAVALLVILVGGFGIIYFFHDILAPLLVAIVLAYLLEWPTTKLQRMGLSRGLAASSVIILFGGIMFVTFLIVVPVAWQQAVNLLTDLPNMLNRFHDFAAELPARYPELMSAGVIDVVAENLRGKLAGLADSVVKYSVASLMGLLTVAIYLILVPLMVFFLLKDKKQMVYAVHRILPRNRGLAGKVWIEMNQQITNYIRGKVMEIVIVAVATYLVFWFMDMRYSLLLAILVGVAVLVPYVGAVLATVPVFIVALFQWGIGPDFWTLIIAYLVVQGLDSNIVVPFLFSEAVNLHPLVIILSVVIFGGLWGFWGVFFAIPLATLVKAVIHVWPDDLIAENLD